MDPKDHLGLVFWAADKIKDEFGVDAESVTGWLYLRLHDLLPKHDPSRGTFSTLFAAHLSTAFIRSFLAPDSEMVRARRTRMKVVSYEFLDDRLYDEVVCPEVLACGGPTGFWEEIGQGLPAERRDLLLHSLRDERRLEDWAKSNGLTKGRAAQIRQEILRRANRVLLDARTRYWIARSLLRDAP